MQSGSAGPQVRESANQRDSEEEERMQSLVSVSAAPVLAGVCFVASGGPRVAAQTTGAAGRGSTATVVVPPGRQTCPLWPFGAPGSEARRDEPEEIQGETIRNVHNPSIVVFLPRKEISTGASLVLAPGGGHTSLWIMHEGFNPAQILAEQGVAVFVLKNRLQSSGYKFDVEGLADMQRAIRLVRSRAAEWGVDPAEVGAGGFSAGGEAGPARRAAQRSGQLSADDAVERQSSRPEFQVLIYQARAS